MERPLEDEQLPPTPTKFYKSVVTIVTYYENDKPFEPWGHSTEVADAIFNGEIYGGIVEQTTTELTPQDTADAMAAQKLEPELVGIQVDKDNKVTAIGYEI